MSVVAAAVVGSAALGVAASNSASRRQADAADRASGAEQAQFQQTREDQAPWRAAGVTALGQLTQGTAAGGDFNRDFTLGDFTRDPGYDFRLHEGQRALDASAAARGGALSGGAVRAATRYGQDYASGEYSNAYNRFNADRTQRFNRLSSVAGIGQTATRDVANQGAQVAANVGSNIVGAGNAAAAGLVGGANAVNGGAQTLGNWTMQQRFLNRFPPAGATGIGGGGGYDPGVPMTAPAASYVSYE